MTRSLLFPGSIRRSIYLAFAASILLIQSRDAVADSVMFNLGGTAVSVATFDELPGNALAVGGQSAIDGALAKLTTPNSTAQSVMFTVYYQANVNLLNANGQTLNNSSQVFTAVAAFNEIATVNNFSGFSNTVTFSLAANQSGSYLDFFAQPSGMVGNNSTGVGFATENGGTLIYSASLPSSGTDSGNFTNTTSASNPPSPLNATGTGSTTQQSVSGYGGTSLTVGTAYYNSSYFIGDPGSLLNFSSTNALTFHEVPPSSSFVDLSQSGVTINSLSYITPQLGAVNGLPNGGGSDFQFQADASSSYVAPEPASIAMTILGLGSVGLGSFFSRRRARARSIVA